MKSSFTSLLASLTLLVTISFTLLCSSTLTGAEAEYKGSGTGAGLKATPTAPSSAIDADPIFGEEYILIDISKQTLFVMKDGGILDESPCGTSRGFGDKVVPTEPGNYTIKEKFGEHHVSKEFDVPMPWAMNIYNGVNIHGSYSFVKPGDASHGIPQSHGCIRLPVDFAQKLNARCKVGTKVRIIGSNAEFTKKTDTDTSALYNVDAKGNYSLKILTDPSPENIANARAAAKGRKLMIVGPKGSPDKCFVGLPHLPDSSRIPLTQFQNIVLNDAEKKSGAKMRKRDE